MSEQWELAADIAKKSGWLIETKEIMPGIIGYQLKNPAGKYVQFGGSEESVWKHAYESGVLPDESEIA